jgi:LacI family transcriptional regulator
MDILQKEVTIYDIAKKLNLSASTVCRALKGTFGTSFKTRKKILAAAEEMGYSANSFASNLRKQSSKTIGVIVPNLDSVFMAEVISGIENEVSKAGYTLLISQSLESFKKEVANTNAMLSNRVEGLLVSLASDTENIDHFKKLIDSGIPVIFFDRVIENDNFPVVTINNHRAGYQITEHLINQGCKTIVHVTGSQLQNVYAERAAGYKQALADHNIPFDPNLFFISGLTYDCGLEFGKQISEMKELPDAVFAANDQFAAGCMQVVKKAGISIPAEIAFAGFNNEPLCSVIEPNLTTVDYNSFHVGQESARQLLDIIDSGASNAYNLVLKHHLIVRASSQKAKASDNEQFIPANSLVQLR